MSGHHSAALSVRTIYRVKGGAVDPSNVAVEDRLFDNPNMSAEGDFPIYVALVALKPGDLSFGSWAVQAGLARNYFTDLRKHGNPSDKALNSLLSVVNVSPAVFHQMRATVRSEVALDGEIKALYAPKGSEDLQVLGTAMGGEFGDLDADIEMTELHSFEVIERLARPASLVDDRHAYALRIVGDSMSPRFKPGERVAVSPRKSVQIGDDVIVQLRGDDGDDGERVKMVLIKELVRLSSTFVELKQYNPEIIFRIDRKRIAHVHVVKGNYF